MKKRREREREEGSDFDGVMARWRFVRGSKTKERRRDFIIILPSNFFARAVKVDDRAAEASRTNSSYCCRLASLSRFSMASVQQVGCEEEEDDEAVLRTAQNRN